MSLFFSFESISDSVTAPNFVFGKVQRVGFGFLFVFVSRVEAIEFIGHLLVWYTANQCAFPVPKTDSTFFELYKKRCVNRALPRARIGSVENQIELENM